MKKNLIDIADSLGGHERLLYALRLNMEWLKKSHSVTNNRGSAKSRNILGYWTGSYPETTGYLIPTLESAAQVLKDHSLFNLSKSNISFLLEIQNSDGSFPVSIQNKIPIVFDSAQILLGLLMAQKSNVLKNKNALLKSYRWLISHINTEGVFSKYNYVPKYNPAYYSRILWPLLLAEKTFGLPFSEKSKLLLKYLLSLHSNNKSFFSSSFHGTQMALSHNIVYTYRGLWESALIINDSSLIKLILEDTMHINRQVISKANSFAGEYDDHWKPNDSFICASGNAQLTVLFLKLYQHTNNTNYLDNIELLMKPLLKCQHHLFFNKGAIPSSIPFWGEYQRFKFTNWTQKFFSDAILSIVTG